MGSLSVIRFVAVRVTKTASKDKDEIDAPTHQRNLGLRVEITGVVVKIPQKVLEEDPSSCK